MKIAHAFGTRACTIKMAPLVRETQKRGHETVILYSGQHWSPNLYEELFDDLELPRPDYDLDARSGGVELGSAIFQKTPKILEKEKPDIVLTHGDTYTANYFSMASAVSLVPVGHVEAGLRTDSWEPFPEQINTRTADACTSLFFAPIEKNKKHLIAEGYPGERIFTVGNTIVDAAFQHKEIALRKSNILDKIKVKHPFVFWSCHRKENLMHEKRIRGIFESLLELEEVNFFCSVLPSTQQAAEKYEYASRFMKAPNIIWTPCLPNYTDAIRLILESDLILTDSGGLQEEASSLKIPCLTLRYVTDRPETVEVGANKCVGTEKENIAKEVRNILQNKKAAERMRKAPNPYGDGTTSAKIVDIIERFEGKMERWETKVKNV